MDAVILCGGEGKRLQTVIKDKPKPMAEINGRPFLDILLYYASSYGYERFILCAGYMAEVIKGYYCNKSFPFELVISEERVPLGTGGAVRNSKRLIGTADFLVMNGDSFCPLDLSEFFAFHKKSNALVSMAVREVDDSVDFGSVILDKNKEIIKFDEKKSGSKALINTGIYLFKKEILSLMPDKTPYSLELDLFPSLIGKGIYGFVTRRPFIDIGTPERFKLAQKLFPEF